MSGFKFGFVGWNPFQILHAHKLASALEGACFVLEKRKNHIDQFDEKFISNSKLPSLIWPRSRMEQLNGVFDVIVCQTPFSQIEKFSKTRIAMLQYGYAKEPHNYGAWRAHADLTLTYGPYATRKITPFCHAIATGNPRYDDWHRPEFHRRASALHGIKLNPSRKTILYLPTWGPLSSLAQYTPALNALCDNYNVLIKLHHNTALLEKGVTRPSDHPSLHYYAANDDTLELLSIADIVISDYSGAIFDAIYCKKHLILVNTPMEDEIGKGKIDAESLEYARRHELGIQVNNANELIRAVNTILATPSTPLVVSQTLREDLFTDTSTATNSAAQALLRLAEGSYQPTISHMAARQRVISFNVAGRSPL